MGDTVIIFLLQNIFIFGLIFWVLTWGAEFFFTKKFQLAKKQFYECGFRTLSELNIQFNLNFSMLCAFLILYDIEFILLYPLIFNYSALTIVELTVTYIFILLIVLALFYDIQFNLLGWQC